jgi:hypothetical protein
MHSSYSRLASAGRASAAICCCGLLLAGCNSEPALGKLVPVKGKITLDDGTPLHDGMVEFVPIETQMTPPYPSSTIEADGSYKLTTHGKSGAPLGKYRAVLTQGEDKKLWTQVNKLYHSVRKSPLEVEVVENKPQGGYDLKLDLKSKRGS